MGRELRRVPLDFAWPLQKVWAGFLNPHWRPCPEQAANNCHGGSTSAGKWLDALARLIGLVGEEGAENTPATRERMERSYSRGAAEEFVRRGWAPTGMGVRHEDGTLTMLRDIETCGTEES